MWIVIWVVKLDFLISWDKFEIIFMRFFVHWHNSESSRFERFHLRQFRTFLISSNYKKEVSLLDKKLNQAFGKAQEAEKIQEQEKLLL